MPHEIPNPFEPRQLERSGRWWARLRMLVGKYADHSVSLQELVQMVNHPPAKDGLHGMQATHREVEEMMRLLNKTLF